MKASELKYTLEENLACTNEEIMTNWTKLASFIMSYELVKWESARKSALNLIKSDMAEVYLNEARKDVLEKQNLNEAKTELKTSSEPLSSNSNTKVIKTVLPTIYEQNYSRLLKIIPKLEEELLTFGLGSALYGKSKSSGYPDFTVEVLQKDKTGFYLSLSHYVIQLGNFVPDPDMEILVVLESKTCYAFNIQNLFGTTSVYDNKFKRKLIDLKEQKSQNKFLATWLKELKSQGHKIEFEQELKPVKSQTLQEILDEVEERETKEKEKVKKESEQNDLSSKKSQLEQKPVEKIDPVKTVKVSETAENSNFKNDVTPEKIEQMETTKTAKARPNDSDLIHKSNKQFLKEINYQLFMDLAPKNTLNQKEKPNVDVFIGDFKFRILKPLNSFSEYILLNHADMANINDEPLAFLVIHKRKQIQILEAHSSIRGFHNFVDKDVSTFSEADFKVQKEFLKFMYKLLKAMNLEKVKLEEKVAEKVVEKLIDSPISVQKDLIPVEVEPAPIPSSVQPPVEKGLEKKNVEESIEQFDPHVKGIPVFEIGKVELTQKHIEAGMTQKDIDYINKNKTGMVLRPVPNMVSNTKDIQLDISKKAKKPGFRVSRTGQIYYESRSNRSDLTKYGF